MNSALFMNSFVECFKPFRLFKRDYGNLPTFFTQPHQVWQHLRLAKRIGQAIVSKIKGVLVFQGFYIDRKMQKNGIWMIELLCFFLSKAQKRNV